MYDLIVRAFIDVRDGDKYVSLVDVPYNKGDFYAIDIDMPDDNSGTYSVKVNGVLIADKVKFRTEQSSLSLSSINNIGVYTIKGGWVKIRHVDVNYVSEK